MSCHEKTRTELEQRTLPSSAAPRAELPTHVLEELRAVRAELAWAEAAGEDFAQAMARSRLAELVDANLLGELLASVQPRPAPAGPLRFPVPYYGGKFGAAPLIERAMGPIVNLVIPFGGSLGSLLGRSRPARVETANDKDGLIVNAWRAVKHDPYGVAEACAHPVHEVTLHAAHDQLIDGRPALTKLLESDPTAYDVRAAAWWIWGRSAYLGGGWCSEELRDLQRQSKRGGRWQSKASLRGGGTGPGIGQGVLSSTARDDLPSYFRALADRLRYVRLTCGDWQRVLTDSVTVTHGVTGVYLDPCYALSTGRRPRLYGVDEPEASDAVRAWALERGEHPRLRIVISGFDDEHAELEEHGWRVLTWRRRERLWLSPGCRHERDAGPLFREVGS